MFQKLISHKRTVQICGSIFLAIVGFYTGQIGGGTIGAFGFSIIFFVWGLAIIPNLLDNLVEKPLKNLLHITLFIVVVISLKYLILK